MINLWIGSVLLAMGYASVVAGILLIGYRSWL